MLQLPARPHLPAAVAAAVAADYERFAAELPPDLPDYLLERYRVDVSGEYAGRRVRSCFGKASGQLSLNLRQVERDAEAGLGFVVLKTVIAQDETGSQSMAAWAIQETHMHVERIVGPRTGREGWSVTWKGRGWWDTFEKYLELCRDAAAVGDQAGMVVAPSVKYHLPTPEEPGFKEAEYVHTTRALLDVWGESHDGPLPLEKDFSPTLAGSEKSRQEEQILTWLRTVPRLIKGADPRPVCLGMKLMNALFEDGFQRDMLRAVIDEADPAPDFLIYANRLFDPRKEFEGKVGVAYGGPDLSERNLSVLEAMQGEAYRRPVPPISGTGDILDGRTAVEYGLRGCTSFQMHTLFQLPDDQFRATMANRTARGLHHLYLHPETGLVAWMVHLREVGGGGVVGVRDLPGIGQ
ncbi:MAG: hypothetical protein HYU66_25290 [Armatimonadetes bacterium]|nr:hypothetical protein [Armatimonadota bacterium]